MKRVFHKTIRREIRHGLGRYFAIVSIIALGSGLFTGLKVTNTDMIKTADVYTQRTALFDYRLISTLGWEEESVLALSGTPGVSAAEGSVTADFIADVAGRDTVLKALPITEDVNKPELVSGRWPENAGECLADSYNLGGLSLGDVITVKEDNDEDTLEAFAVRSFTVTGFARTPLYMNFERGTTTVGNGSIGGFVLVPKEAFDSEAFTEINLTLSETGYVYTDAYDDAVSAMEDRVTAAAEEAASARFDRLRLDAERELSDGLTEYTDGVKEYEDGLAEYTDGVKEYEDGLREYEDGLKEYEDGLREYEDGLKEYEDGKKEYEDGKKDYLGTRRDTRLKISASSEQIESNLSALESQRAEAKAALSELQAQKKQISSSGLPEEQAAAALAYINSKIAECNAGLEKIESGIASLKAARQELASAKSKASAGFNEAKDKLADAEQELLDAEEELADAKQELLDAEKELADAKQELLDAEKELADAEEELKDGRKDLISGRNELIRAKQQILSLEKPEVYVLDRYTNAGYACFDNDAGIVSGVAKVFPFFFFAVAALVCITTTNRMVDDERGQIGVFKALGYSRAAITGRYLFYTGSASLLGVVIGCVGGSLLFPPVIWMAYGIMYSMPELEILFDTRLMLLAGGSYLMLALFVTWTACRKELIEPAAELIRPKSPPPGKRILLERVGFIWKRLSFLRKVSLRNVFRYRKRLIMMMLGIGGCTALLITGFGINDSITHIADRQYGEVSVYDALVSFRDDIRGKEERFLRRAGENVTKASFLYSASADIRTEEASGSVNLLAAEDFASLDGLMDFHTLSREPVPAPSKGGCLISRNLAEKYGVAAGDSITLQVNGTDEVTLCVEGVFENIIYHYVYCTLSSLGDKVDGLKVKTAYLGFKDGADPYETGSALSNMTDTVGSVQLTADMLSRVNSMLGSMKYIILLIIACAGALSFIVLFNLTSINIQERIREIATLRVLGFHTRESARYVFRENNILTFCGCAAGVPMGIALHDFVMSEITIDMMAFETVRTTETYLISIAITFAFTWAVDAFMRPRISSIEMAESLKSIE